MYSNYQPSYYGKRADPMSTKDEFATPVPLIVIDCSKQNETQIHAMLVWNYAYRNARRGSWEDAVRHQERSQLRIE
ncbi:hypothetical protein PV325_006964 [Microctonus aethiopoides]|nr:hypothetical protein PV325_006964 [Microctonus aethiopoides]